MRKWIAVVVLMFVASSARAQAPSLEAHRLYFVAVTSWMDKAPDTAASAIRSYLNTAGVAESEHGVAIQALAKFKNRYDALIDAYNHSAATLAGNNDDTALFLTQLDVLTQSTIELLQASLSAQSSINLTERVKHDSMYIRDVGMGGPPVAVHHHSSKFTPAQGGGMNPHYSASHSDSVSVDANGNYTYYATPSMTGYTSCSYCPYYHTGTVVNDLNGNQPVSGPRVTATSYISVSNPASAQFLVTCFNADPAAPCSNDWWNEDSYIVCSSGQHIFGWGNFRFVAEAAVTFSQVTQHANGGALLQDWCQLQYEPPDFNPSVLLNAQQDATYVLGGAICINSTWNSGFWLCSPGVSYSLTGTYLRKYCTHNIPPY